VAIGFDVAPKNVDEALADPTHASAGCKAGADSWKRVGAGDSQAWLRSCNPQWRILQPSRTDGVEETAGLRPCCRRRRAIRLKTQGSNPCWESAFARWASFGETSRRSGRLIKRPRRRMAGRQGFEPR
jgi:hypothetical protein